MAGCRRVATEWWRRAHLIVPPVSKIVFSVHIPFVCAIARIDGKLSFRRLVVRAKSTLKVLGITTS